ncbi:MULTISPECIES: SipW-dependent-type signal peptide-containing protein [Micrococcaceae]|uniref:SipW-dependent-type signal peptide-containing protein n=1 Tax=Micrococcaceae TaxID=1268 RepID=UPI00161A2D15|nr:MULTISPECIES: SipW-dependent-type signal peptide-containing protein [Micrococcaceae]MBB5749541.1 putative ribosomally synthesized peptide with SipW-like signal peptide [Micrococcus sp. TA1]HRO31433.1 SipW-dependent-type signal peptide-containing protein [Citricoccus sp.]
MRTKNMLLTAAVIGLAVVAGSLGVGGTWALWNASMQSNPGTVQAANFDITVNGKSIPADGSNVSLALEDQTTMLSPTQNVYAAVTVTNATNASGPFNVRAGLSAPVPASGTEADMKPYLILTTAPRTSGTCSDVPSGAYTTAAKSVQVPKDQSASYCVQVALEPNAPPSLSGRTVTAVLDLSVSQLPAGV